MVTFCIPGFSLTWDLIHEHQYCENKLEHSAPSLLKVFRE